MALVIIGILTLVVMAAGVVFYLRPLTGFRQIMRGMSLALIVIWALIMLVLVMHSRASRPPVPPRPGWDISVPL